MGNGKRLKKLKENAKAEPQQTAAPKEEKQKSTGFEMKAFELEGKNVNLMKENSSLRDKVANYKKQIDKLVEENKTLPVVKDANSKSSAGYEIGTLEKKIKQLQIELAKEQNNVTRLNEEKATILAKLHQGKQKPACQQKIDTPIDDLQQKLEKSNIALEEAKTSHRIAVADHKEQMKQVRKELLQSKSDLSKLNKEKSALSEKLITYKQERFELWDEVGKNDAQVSDLISQLNASKLELTGKEELLQKFVGILREQISLLRSMLGQNFEHGIGASDVQIVDLEDNLIKLNNSVVSEKIRLVHDISDLKHLVNQLQDNLANARNDARDLECRNTRISSELRTKKEELVSIQKQLNETNSYFSGLQRRLDAAVHEIDDLTSNLNQCQEAKLVAEKEVLKVNKKLNAAYEQIALLEEVNHRAESDFHAPVNDAYKENITNEQYLNEALQPKLTVDQLKEMAWSMIEKQKYDEAIEFLQQAIFTEEKGQHNSQTIGLLWHEFSWCHAKLGRFSVALDASDTAIQYDSTDTSYFCHRGLIQKKLDNYFKAAADFRQAIKLDPHNQAARDMLAKL